MTTEEMPTKPHQGKNVKRFREMLDMKQEALAAELGPDWTQRRISLLEQREIIDHETLKLVAKALKVPEKAIENFTEEAAYNVIGNTVTNNENVAFFQYNPVFNPVEKWMESVEEIKKLNAALLKEKDEKIALLERMLNEKK